MSGRRSLRLRPRFALGAIAQTLNQLGLVGANLQSLDDYWMDRLHSNIVTGSRNFQGTTVDANGWPTTAWSLVVSTKNGNCPPGTYKGRYLGAAAVVTASSGVTITNTSYSGGFQNFDMIVPAWVVGTNTIIQGSAALTQLEIVRPGLGLPGSGYPVWNPDAINYLKQLNSIRFMKPLSVECLYGATNVTLGSRWATRNTPTNNKAGYPGAGMPHEYVIDLANTLYTAPGSNLKAILINFFAQADDDYITQCSTLYKNTLNPAIQVIIENGNENWNSSYAQVLGFFQSGAVADVDGAWAQTSNPFFVQRFASIVGDGVKTITITFLNNHNRTTGDSIFVGSGPSNVATAAPTACTVISPTVLTYQTDAAAASGAQSLNGGILYIGRPNTGVSYDGTANINLLMRRWQLHEVRRVSLLVEAVFGSSVGPRAFVITGQQQPDFTSNTVLQTGSGFGESSFRYLRDVFTSRAVKTYIYAIALHPYTDQALPNTAASVSDYIALLNTSITRNLNEMKAFQTLAICYGLRLMAYEWGPSFVGNGVAGRTAVEVATSRDDRMRVHMLAAFQAFANMGLWIQHFFMYSPFDDYNQPPSADNDDAVTGGNENWVTNGNPLVIGGTPKTQGLLQALNLTQTINDAQCLISGATAGAVSTIEAQDHGQVDRHIQNFNNTDWTNPNAGTNGAGTIGYNRGSVFGVIGNVARWVEFGVLVLNPGTYTVNMWGFVGNTAGTPENVAMTLDGGALLSYAMPGLAGGGDFINGTPPANTEQALTLPAGYHVIRLTVPASPTGQVSIRKLVFTKT